MGGDAAGGGEPVRGTEGDTVGEDVQSAEEDTAGEDAAGEPAVVVSEK